MNILAHKTNKSINYPKSEISAVNNYIPLWSELSWVECEMKSAVLWVINISLLGYKGWMID